jgi:hypothetical protein
VIEQRGISSILPKISDDQNGIVIAKVRLDPDIEVRDVAVGGLTVTQFLNGANDLPLTIMEHITWDARATESQLFYEPKDTELERALSLKPTVMISTDLYANDFVGIDLSGMGPPNVNAGTTSLDTFSKSLDAVLERLDHSGAEVFIANGPDPSFMKSYRDKVQSLLAAGYSEHDANQWRYDLRARIQAYNTEFARLAASRKHIHVVDLFGRVEDVVARGVPAGGHVLQAEPFGGLLSFDGMHFSDTGYAMAANLFIDQINLWLGEGSIPQIDLDAVYASDPYSIESLKAQGFSCAGTL